MTDIHGAGAATPGPGDFRARLSDARILGASFASSHDLLALRAVIQPSAMFFVGSQGLRPAGFDDIVENTKTRMNLLVQTLNDEIAAAHKAYGDSNAFIEKMEQSRKKAIVMLDATINDAYAKLEEIGKDHPAQQAKMAQAMGEVSSLCTSAKNSVNHTFDTAIRGVEHLLATIGSGIGHAAGAVASGVKDAAETVAGGVKGAAEAVAHGVESIFHGW